MNDVIVMQSSPGFIIISNYSEEEEAYTEPISQPLNRNHTDYRLE